MLKKFCAIFFATLILIYSNILISMELPEKSKNIEIRNNSPYTIWFDTYIHPDDIKAATIYTGIEVKPGEEKLLDKEIDELESLEIGIEDEEKTDSQKIDINALKDFVRKNPDKTIFINVDVQIINSKAYIFTTFIAGNIKIKNNSNYTIRFDSYPESEDLTAATIDLSIELKPGEIKSLDKSLDELESLKIIVEDDGELDSKKIDVNALKNFALRNANKTVFINVAVKIINSEAYIITAFNTGQTIIENYQNQFRLVFDNVPDIYHDVIAMQLNNSLKRILQEIEYDANEAKIFAYTAVLNNLDIGLNQALYSRGGYIFFLLKNATGHYIQPNGCREIETAKESNDFGKLKEFTGAYKIHLMPKQSDIFQTIITLAKNINDNKKFGSLIRAFKVLAPKSIQESEMLPSLDEEERFARIVIYPTNGKEKVQKLLGKIINLFSHKEGRDFTPRFNQRVTSFIYFAQGDGDCKSNPDFQKYFEQPDLIYYAPDFTGKYEDYHLKF